MLDAQRKTKKQDLKLVGAKAKDAEDRIKWRQTIRCGNP